MMKSNHLLLFLLLQSLFSLLIVFSLIFMKKVVLVLLLSKMGLPPFHYWVINSQMMWNSTSFLLFISLHKWTPTIIMMSILSVMWISVLFMLLGFVLFWNNINLKIFILGMSVNDMGWMIFSWLNSLKTFLMYLMVNMIIFFITLNVLKKSTHYSLNLVIMMMIMVNMPPFFSFLIKWMIVSNLSIVYSVFSLIISWLTIMMVWFWLSLKILSSQLFFTKINNFLKIVITSFMMWVL